MSAGTNAHRPPLALSLFALVVLLGLAMLLRPVWMGPGEAIEEPASDAVVRAIEAELEEPEVPTSESAPVERSEAVAVVETNGTEAADVADGDRPGGPFRVVGTIFGLDGQPLAGAIAMTEAPDGSKIRASSDEQGAYALDLPGTGRWLLSGGALDYFTEYEPLEVGPEDGEIELDFVLRPKQRIAVLLRRSNGLPTYPLAESEYRGSSFDLQSVPVATREHPGDRFDGVVGSLNNEFGIGHFWQAGEMWDWIEDAGEGHVGTLTIDQDVDEGFVSYVVADQVLATEPFTRTTQSVVLTVDAAQFADLEGSIVGRLVDPETGAGLVARLQWSSDRAPNRPTWAESELDGTFRLEGLLPGSRYLSVRAEGRAHLLLERDLLPGETLDLGEIELPREVRLTGRVFDADGKPTASQIAHGNVDPSSGRIAWNRQYSYTSNVGGGFVVARIGPGRHALRVEHLGRTGRDESQRSRVHFVDVESGELGDIELRLERTTPVNLIQAWTTEPWPIARWVGTDGTVEASAYLGRWAPEWQMHLCPGDYTLRVELDGSVVDERRVTVGTEPQQIEIGLTEG